MTLEQGRKFQRCIAVYTHINGLIDLEFNFSLNKDIHNYNTMFKNNVHLGKVKRNWGKKRFSYHVFSDWNSLSLEIRDSISLANFKSCLKYDFINLVKSSSFFLFYILFSVLYFHVLYTLHINISLSLYFTNSYIYL